MQYQIKPQYLGKVRLENGTGSFLLDESTPQDVLAQLYETEVGKLYIDLLAAPVVADQTK